jgi:hypothetical protein
MYCMYSIHSLYICVSVSDKKDPEYSRGRLSEARGSWVSGYLEGGEGWVKGGANGISLQAT